MNRENIPDQITWVLDTSNKIEQACIETKKINSWLFKIWFILVSVILALAHILLLFMLPEFTKVINKNVSLVFQLSGGLLVLCSINSDLNIADNKSIKSFFKDWLETFPLKAKKQTFNVVPGAVGIGSASPVELKTGKHIETIEQRLEFLQEQINEIEKDCNKNHTSLKKQILRTQNYLDEKISKNETKAKEIDVKIKEISVGGFGQQIFGVITIIHGSLASYFS